MSSPVFVSVSVKIAFVKPPPFEAGLTAKLLLVPIKIAVVNVTAVVSSVMVAPPSEIASAIVRVAVSVRSPFVAAEVSCPTFPVKIASIS